MIAHKTCPYILLHDRLKYLMKYLVSAETLLRFCEMLEYSGGGLSISSSGNQR